MESLESCCISSVKSNMEFFVNEYKFGNSIPKQYFLFLQRMYSKNLLASFSRGGDLIKYLDFLLNPYLKEIDLQSFVFEQTDIELIVQQVKRIGETVKLFDVPMHHSELWHEKSLLELTSSLPNVEALSIIKTDTTKRVLKNIRKNCPALKDLDLSWCDIDDSALEAMWIEDESMTTGMPSTLVRLDILSTNVTENGLILALKHFPNLEIVESDHDLCRTVYDLHFDDFSKNSLSGIKYNLKKMDINGDDPMVCTALKIFTFVCPHISTLFINATISQAVIEACTKLYELEVITLSDLHLDFRSTTVTPLIQCSGKNLTFLSIAHMSISIESVLKHCPKLQTLYFDDLAFEFHEDVRYRETSCALPYLKKLGFIEIDFDEMTAKAFNLILSSAPKLEEITLNGSTNLTDDFIRTVTRHNCMSVVRGIDLSWTNICFSAAREILFSTPNLTYFKLYRCRYITHAEFEYLKGVRHNVDFNLAIIR